MKVAVSLQQILWITKEIDVDDNFLQEVKISQNISIPILPTDKPVVKNIVDIFDENCNLLFSIGRDKLE